MVAKDKSKKFNKSITGLFVGVIVLVGGINLLKKDTQFSEAENRNLATMPKFSTSTYASGEFAKDYNDYISDQFLGRNLLVSLKTRMDLLLGKSKLSDVYVGKGDILAQNFKIEDEEQTNKKVDAINAFFNKHKNIKTSILLAPTSTSINRDLLPKTAILDDEHQYINLVKSKLNSSINFIDVFDDIYKNKDNYMYYKTDHHWTSDAAFIAYNKMCSVLGFPQKSKDDYEEDIISNNFSGSLNSKIGLKINQDTIKAYVPKKEEENQFIVNYATEQKKVTTLYDVSSLDKKDQYQVFMSGNHPLVDIQTLKDPKQKILVLKDSYANSFVPFLTANYGEIFVVDLRYYTDDINALIKDNDINNILYLYNANTFNSDGSILNLN